MSKEFISLEPAKTWITVDDTTKQAKTYQCCVCNDYCNAQSFKATYYPKGWADGASKTEYYCRKHARETFPYYFK